MIREIPRKEVLAALPKIDMWLGRLGIQIKNDRLHGAFSLMREAVEGTQQLRAAGKPARTWRHPDHFYAVTEALEFHDIFQAFEHDPGTAIGPKLRRALSGPMRPLDETKENADARNLAFELALAAEWRLHNLEVLVGEPDITLRVKGVPFLVECKRPHRVESLRPNMRDAVGQLSRELTKPNAQGVMGLVAVSVSRILTAGKMIFHIYSEDEHYKLREEVVRSLRENEHRWTKLEFHPRIVGVLFHAVTPLLVENTDTLIRTAYTFIYPRGKPGPALNLLREAMEQVYPPTREDESKGRH